MVVGSVCVDCVGGGNDEGRREERGCITLGPVDIHGAHRSHLHGGNGSFNEGSYKSGSPCRRRLCVSLLLTQ